MHVAAKWGKIKMVNLLMSKGANIEAKTRDGLTPLHCAARSGHHEVVDILIEKGAPIGSKTKVRTESTACVSPAKRFPLAEINYHFLLTEWSCPVTHGFSRGSR